MKLIKKVVIEIPKKKIDKLKSVIPSIFSLKFSKINFESIPIKVIISKIKKNIDTIKIPKIIDVKILEV